MRTFETKKNACPYCGTNLDAASNFGDEAPSPNDVSVCIECGVYLSYDKDLNLHLLSDNDFKSLSTSVKSQLEVYRSVVLKGISRRVTM